MIPAMIGTTEILLIALVVLVLFGGSKIPQLMRGLGQGITEFKKGVHDSGSPEAPPGPPPPAEKH